MRSSFKVKLNEVRMSRTKRVAILAIVIVASILAFQFLIPQSAPTKIMIGIAHVNTSYWPICMAMDLGLYQKHNLDAEIVVLNSAQNTMAALTAGQIQIGCSSITSTISAKLEGIDIIQVGATEKLRPFYLVARPDIKSVRELKGRVGAVVTVGSGLDYLAMVTMLRRMGLDPSKDVTLVGIAGLPAQLAALEAGKIDFTLTSEVLRVKKLGLNVLLYLPDIIDEMPGGGYATTTVYLKENREIVKRFTKAITEATRFFFENKEESKMILSKWLKEDDPESLDQHYQDWSRVALKIPEIDINQVSAVLEAMAPFTQKAAYANPEEFLDNSIVKELQDEGFFESIWGASSENSFICEHARLANLLERECFKQKIK